MYASIGNINFEGLFGFQSLDRTGEAVFAEIPRIAGKPALQRVGSKLDQISMSISLHRSFVIPEEALAELVSYRDRSEVLTITTGAGEVLGDFVIQRIAESIRKTGPDGTLVRLVLDLQLLEHPSSNRLLLAQQQATAQAQALEENSPVPAEVSPVLPGTSQAMQAVTAAESESAGAAAAAVTAQQVSAQETVRRRQVQRYVSKVIVNAEQAQSLINATTGDLFTNTRDLDSKLSALLSLARALLSAAGNVSIAIAVIVSDSASLLAKAKEAKDAAQALSRFISIRIE